MRARLHRPKHKIPSSREIFLQIYFDLQAAKQDQLVNSSGLEQIYTLMDGRTDIQKSDLYSEVALAI